MSDDILKQLETYKQKIDARKSERNQVDAELKWIKGKLKETFDCDSIEEAQGLLVEMISEADANRQTLKDKYAELVREAQEKGLI
jgi:predicted nuclease with TOPRIM domain